VRRRKVVVAVVVSALVVGGGLVWYRLATGGEVTAVGVEDAVDRFRDAVATTLGPSGATDGTDEVPATSAPSESVPGTEAASPTTVAPATTFALPETGVYTYATTGFDSVDALTGARHDYPAVTTITVTPHDCGVRLRWDVAEERWDTWDWCLEGDAMQMTGWVGYHEFFDVGGRNDYVCEGDPRPLDADPGTTWTTVCRMEDRTTSTFTGEVVERTTLAVAGAPVDVLHVRIAADVVGESTGQQVVEGWYRVTDGLPVREQLSIATKQETVIGTTNFTEEYTIELQSLDPLS
jgi:hypothetical protein